MTNVNEPPVFSGNLGTHSVAENTPANQNIGNPVTATDPDNGDTLTYSLGGTDADSFTIVATSGQLKTKAPLDYETAKRSYSVTVTATDSTNSAATVSVTITVTNVNEPPEFPSSETGTRRVAENTGVGQNIGFPVEANDPDADAALTYTLGGNDAASFDMDRRTGQLKAKAALNYEAESSYSVTVSVSDGEDAEGNADNTTDATVRVTIVVTDVNEAPAFAAATTTHTVEENTADGIRHRGSNHSHRPRQRLHAELFPGRNRRRGLRHQSVNRPVADQEPAGL